MTPSSSLRPPANDLETFLLPQKPPRAPSRAPSSRPRTPRIRGKPPEDTWEYGVGFAVRNTLLGAIVPPTGGSETFLVLHLNAIMGSVHPVSGYARTLNSPAEIKDRSYEELDTALGNIPKHEHLDLRQCKSRHQLLALLPRTQRHWKNA
ncbi:hypothetical protein AAFF_G00271090 [Aldrovandia affinis]|uniref:Uncharacterized protein n=1 Tax=Aldrovandia affinis TaxID=143900 RepID=A0AAD7RAW2_9TELE|nr:hypothetical protein AAFF_G00271090 [Aldrovandia affinis]